MQAVPRAARRALVCGFVASTLCGRAQQFGFTQYTPKEGLAQSQVRCIAQDAEGYLWFGTLGGVSRFDVPESKCAKSCSCETRACAS